MLFEAIIELKINLKKSELIPIGRMGNVEVAFEIGYRVGGLSMTYLALPLGFLFKSMAACDEVEE